MFESVFDRLLRLFESVSRQVDLSWSGGVVGEGVGVRNGVESVGVGGCSGGEFYSDGYWGSGGGVGNEVLLSLLTWSPVSAYISLGLLRSQAFTSLKSPFTTFPLSPSTELPCPVTLSSSWQMTIEKATKKTTKVVFNIRKKQNIIHQLEASYFFNLLYFQLKFISQSDLFLIRCQLLKSRSFPKFQNQHQSMKVLGQVIKSAGDKRTYRAIELPNKLTCLIVSDPQAQKSSAALSVQVGSMQDPEDAQGLAHYLQHMLFMGTTKYPNQNEYSDFLAKNSGGSNAYTSQNQTNYFFEVSSLVFRDMLDRFAQFFIAPLMAESSSARELMAVNSEHSKNILNDAWRQYQLWKSSARKGNPLAKFSTGDKNSLGSPTIRNQLLEFYGKNYSANLMKLVVYGKEDVNSMSQYVAQTFGPIPTKELHAFRLKDLPFDESNLGNLYKVVPIKNKNTVQYLWFVSNYEPEYKNSPGRYLSHLIGHEGPGSLLSLLIKQGLALQLSAGSEDEFHLYTKMDIVITLTDKGLENINLITSHLLFYVDMLRKEGPQKWVFDEIKKINKLKFDNLDKKQGMSACAELSKTMHDVRVEEVLVRDYLMEEWKPELITGYLDQLHLKNLRIIVTSQKFAEECKETQPIYGTKYSISPLPHVQPIACDVHLPPPNPFFPEDLSLLPLPKTQQPTKLQSDQYIDLFFKQDHRFELAKGQIKIRLYYMGGGSARHKIVRDIFEQLLKNHLREIKYMAETAYITTKLDFHTFYVDMDIKGFNDSLTKFVPQYLKMILDFEPTDTNQYEDIRAKKTRQYSNFFMSNPYEQAYQYHILSLRDGADVDPAAKVTEVKRARFEAIKDFGKYWKQSLFAELYVAGNFNEEKAKVFGKVVEDLLKTQEPLNKGVLKTIRSVVLHSNETWVVEKHLQNPNEKNNALILHFQYEKLGIHTKLLQDLCLNYIKQPAFDYLRTKQQLGYIVMCLPDDNRGILGLSILVQSDVKSSHELRGYIDNLMKQLKQKIDSLSKEEFEDIKKAAHSVKTQKDKDLSVETERFWAEVAKHTYEFQRKKKELDLLPKIELEEFKKFFNRVLLDEPKRFETHLVSSASKEANKAALEERQKKEKLSVASSVEEFKKKMSLYPDHYALL